MVDKSKTDEYLKNILDSYAKIYENSIDSQKDELLRKELSFEEKNFNNLLKDYPYIFDDLNYSHNFYDKYFVKNPNFILKRNFSSFLNFVFDKLLDNKIIDKKAYDYLGSLLTKFNFNNQPINIWPY